MLNARQTEFVERHLASASDEAELVGGADTPHAIQRFLLRLPAFRGPQKGREVREALIGQLAAVVLTGLAAAARYALNPILPPSLPFLTFFPCIVITGFVWGLAPALTSAILSGLAAWYWFMPSAGGFYVHTQAVTAIVFYAIVVAIDLGLLQLAIFTARSLGRTQQALSKSLAIQSVVSAEVEHRLKNLFATVNGLIGLSQKYAETPAELSAQLRERINAMAQSVALLRGAAQGENPCLREVIASTLNPLGADGARLSLVGPDNELVTNALIPLNLTFHELGTNSIKYGALSVEDGTVSITWDVLASASSEPMLRLVWTERNGPKVAPPVRSGFGTVLINRMSQSLGGSCDFCYAETGLVVTITLQGSRLMARRETPELSA